KFPPHRSDQALHEWVGQWHARHGLDFIDFQNPKIRSPAVSLEHGIVIGAEMSGDTLVVNGGVEDAADVGAADRAAMHADADETARELVHDHEYPVTPEHDRLAAKEVNAPEAVCPCGRGTTATKVRSRPAQGDNVGQHAVHDVLVDVDSERLRDDARNP